MAQNRTTIKIIMIAAISIRITALLFQQSFGPNTDKIAENSIRPAPINVKAKSIFTVLFSLI